MKVNYHDICVGFLRIPTIFLQFLNEFDNFSNFCYSFVECMNIVVMFWNLSTVFFVKVVIVVTVYQPVPSGSSEVPVLPYEVFPPFKKNGGMWATSVPVIALFWGLFMLVMVPNHSMLGGGLTPWLASVGVMTGLSVWLKNGVHVLLAWALALVAIMVLPVTLGAVLPLGVLTVLGRGKGGSSDTMATLPEVVRPVWGVAGSHVAGNAAFGIKAGIGAEGEQAVGQALESLVQKYPFVRVFHGAQFTPGKDGADMDHILLIGSQVFLIDAKNWSIADYEWILLSARDKYDGTPFWLGDVHRNGYSFPGGDVAVGASLNKWRTYLGGIAQVQARIVMSKPEIAGNHYTITDRAGIPDYQLKTVNTALAEFDNIAANTKPVVDRRLVRKISQALQK